MAKILKTKLNAGRVAYKVNGVEDEDSGAKKAYARLVPYSKLDKNYILTKAAEFAGMTEAQMEAGFAALSEAIQYFVLNGHSVTLNGLGTFSFSTKTGIWNAQTQKWESAGRDSMDDVSSNDIKGVYLRFRPCNILNDAIGSSKFFYADGTAFGYQTNHQDVKPKP